MRTKLIAVFSAFTLIVTICNSQALPLGQWKDYLSYQQGLTVSQGGGKIYCCCASGVFSYNTSDNSIERYNKVTGLSDIGCTVARYNTYTNTLVIGYSDGNIDLVANGQITNIPDLKSSFTQGSKAINNIYFYNNFAFLSCGQGVMELDLNLDIIVGLYYIGPSASALNVYSTTVYNDTLYAATTKGIYYISMNDPNFSDFQDWSVIPNTKIPAGAYDGIVTCGTKLYASFAKHLPPYWASNQDTIYEYQAGKWSVIRDAKNNISGINDNVYSLQVSIAHNTPYLVYCGTYNAGVIDTGGDEINKIISYGFSTNTGQNDALIDNNLNVWIADAVWGLVESATNNTGQSFYPPGPYSNRIFAMASQGSNLYIAPGGYSSAYAPNFWANIGVEEYSNGSWSRMVYPPLNGDTISDMCCVAVDPNNPNHACAGSWDHGMVEYNNNTITNVYSGAPGLENYFDAGYYTVRIGGVGFDTSGNMWASNSSVNSDYFKMKAPDGTWKAFNFGGIAPAAQVAFDMLITQSGAKWTIFPNYGILAYQDDGTHPAPSPSNSVFITDAVGNGALPSLKIYCMTQDLNGAVWVGTDAQVVVFYSPDNIYGGPGGWDAQNVYVQQTGYTQYLMQNQYTTAIAVDGANRKWIGTLGGGVFLMSADGTQQIFNFTAENSPLLSDNIQSITINQQTGEVFFGTDQGLVSFRGTSTEGNTNFSNVYAYPDPVPHGYTGPIAIKNLVTNSDVKIATVSGEIVYHTIALGGQAVWNGTNFNGERVQTGVYLVFCTSPDGTQSVITKLLLEN